jgi:hypothetical protein
MHSFRISGGFFKAKDTGSSIHHSKKSISVHRDLDSSELDEYT